MDFLIHAGAIVDLSDVCGDYDVYTSKMIEERVEIKEGDILVIHTAIIIWLGSPTADEIRYMVQHPGPIASSPTGRKPRSCAGLRSIAAVPIIR